MTVAPNKDDPKRRRTAPVTGSSRPDGQVPVIAMMFDRERLPELHDLAALVQTGMAFGVAHHDEEAGHAELCLNGMLFDCLGLASGAPLRVDTGLQQIALPSGFIVADKGVLTLGPAMQLAGAGHLLPVVQSLMGVVMALAQLPGARAVAWLPARLVMSIDWFVQAVGIWLKGGPFPALALSALARTDHGYVSRGLSYFMGQEFVLCGNDGIVREIHARGAVRLTDWLVANGRVDHPCTIELTGFGTVEIEPQGQNTLLARGL